MRTGELLIVTEDEQRTRSGPESQLLLQFLMGEERIIVDGYRIEPLSALTWDGFADLAERHNGVWGGCWCTWFHCFPDPPERKTFGNREFKRRLVEEDRAHAALVFAGGVAVAWAEYGPVEELPNIHHRKEWEQGDWAGPPCTARSGFEHW